MITTPEPDEPPCDHDWRYQNGDFDHEFGTQRVRYWECNLCGERCGESDYTPDELDPDDPEDDLPSRADYWD